MPDLSPGGSRAPRKTKWQPGDTAWAIWVALLPTLFVVATLVGAHFDEHRRSFLGDLLSNWYFLGIFGSALFVPVMVVSLLGASALARQFRFGRWLSTAGSVTALVLLGAIVYGSVAEALSDDPWHDPNSWAPRLSAGEHLVFAAPYLAIAIANACLLVRLWRGPAQLGPAGTQA